MNLKKTGETEIWDADEDLDPKVKRRSVYSYENGIRAVQLYILSAAVMAYLMEYAEDWSVSRVYLNPQPIQTLLQKAA